MHKTERWGWRYAYYWNAERFAGKNSSELVLGTWIIRLREIE